jgi:hypothetical protein
MTIAEGPPPLTEVFARMSLPQKIGLTAAGITIIASSIGVLNQLAIAEPYWPATRSFVEEKIIKATSKLETRQIATQIYLANSEYARIQNELANKQVLLEQNPTMPQGVRDSIQEQIRALQRTLEATRNQLDDLRREQSGRRP